MTTPGASASTSDDRVVVFGSTLAAGANRVDADYVLVGLTKAGVLDTAFGTGGTVKVDSKGSGIDNPRNLIVQSDGKIVATGYSADGDGVVSPHLIRTSTTGVLDATFGTGGVATAKVLPGVAESYTVRQQGDNYVLGRLRPRCRHGGESRPHRLPLHRRRTMGHDLRHRRCDPHRHREG